MSQFVIPPPYKVWCHLCNEGFMTMEDGQKHDKENLNKHQMINARKKEQRSEDEKQPK